MVRKNRFPPRKKFGDKYFKFHSLYVASRAKKRAQGQRDRWKKQGYLVRIFESAGAYALYRRKK